MENKRGSVWIWILIILILIAVGIAIYFILFSGGDVGSIVGGSNSIPEPPALPE